MCCLAAAEVTWSRTPALQGTLHLPAGPRGSSPPVLRVGQQTVHPWPDPQSFSLPTWGRTVRGSLGLQQNMPLQPVQVLMPVLHSRPRKAVSVFIAGHDLPAGPRGSQGPRPRPGLPSKVSLTPERQEAFKCGLLGVPAKPSFPCATQKKQSHVQKHL